MYHMEAGFDSFCQFLEDVVPYWPSAGDAWPRRHNQLGVQFRLGPPDLLFLIHLVKAEGLKS